MHAVIFVGLQGAGKSSWYAATYAATHVRLNLDMLRSRHREAVLLHACLAVGQPFVIDNTNPTRGTRARYVAAARVAGFRVDAVVFDVGIDDALARNRRRPEAIRVPDRAIRGTAAKREAVALDEGYERVVTLRLDASGDPYVHREETIDA